MTTICFGGKEREASFVIYEVEGESIAQVNTHRETLKTEKVHNISPAKKWVNMMLDTCCCEQNEIDRFNF